MCFDPPLELHIYMCIKAKQDFKIDISAFLNVICNFIACPIAFFNNCKDVITMPIFLMIIMGLNFILGSDLNWHTNN